MFTTRCHLVGWIYPLMGIKSPPNSLDNFAQKYILLGIRMDTQACSFS